MKTNFSKFTNLHNKKSRLSTKQRTKVTRRKVIIVAAATILLLTSGLFIFFNLSNLKNTFAAANGDYRSKASGNWNSTATWEKYNGTAWVAATATPTSTSGVITIQTGHTVTVTANVTVDQVVVNSGGQVTQNSGTTLTIANGTGTDFDVSGIFKSAGSVSFNASVSVVFETGGKYQHNFTTTAGTIPTATWSTGSTCEIIGYTTNATAPAGMQSFSNFIWNCPSQTTNINLAGNLTTITGDFTVSNTNTGQLYLASAASTLNVTGNYIQTGGTLSLCSGNNITSTFNISGNYTQSGGTISVVNGTGSTGNINVTGNWSHTGGTITVGGNSSTSALISFNSTGSQTFTSSGATVTGNVDYKVNSGSTLVLGTNILTGRNFTLSSGGSITIGDAAGITSSGATGNIQSTGTRSFSTGANYTYNGSSAQNTGNGLPATINNITINNSSGLTLSGTVAVSNSINLTSGKIITGNYELQSTNNSGTGIIGYSASCYIVGNLRLTVSGTGTYIFPIGSTSTYELATVNLSSITGFTTLLGKFTNANPVNSSYPLTNLVANEAAINNLLDYGYWTFTPNSAMTAGTYQILLYEKGFSDVIVSSNYYCVVNRASVSSSWSVPGNNEAFSYLSGSLKANKTGLTAFGDFAIGYGQGPPILSFTNPTLISGTDGQVNAVYLFSNVGLGLDAWITITDLTGGATVSGVDNFTAGNGYDDAWQPYVNVASNTTSSVGWQINFKVAGTSTDTIVPNIIFAAIDVDGDGASLKEFVEAYQPTSISQSAGSLLQITNTSGNFTAVAGTPSSISNIDTTHTEAMFKVTYSNINQFRYRTGAITTGTGATRQASLYFKSFYDLPVTTLPIELIYFNAKLNSDLVELSWATASELNNDYFTIERSSDGILFEELLRKNGAGNSTNTLYYSAVDPNPMKGYSYYRLKQTDYDGHYSYSEIKTVKNKTNGADDKSALKIISVSPNPFSEKFIISFMLKTNSTVEFQLLNSSGQLVFKDVIKTNDGMNQYDYIDQTGLPKGIYFITLIYNDQKQVQKIVKN